MNLAKSLLAGIALLALQTASAQEAASKLWNFKWGANLGAASLHQDSPGRIVVTLSISIEDEGTPPTAMNVDPQQSGEQLAHQTTHQLADADPIAQQLSDLQQFGVWVLASDGSALPGTVPPLFLPGWRRSVTGESMNSSLAFAWDRSTALSAVVLRVRDKYYVYPILEE